MARAPQQNTGLRHRSDVSDRTQETRRRVLERALTKADQRLSRAVNDQERAAAYSDIAAIQEEM